MFDRDKWKEIWGTITRNRTRSTLTAFGVFWGIFMFIILVGFGNGFRNNIMENMSGFSSRTSFIISEPTGEPYKGYRKGRRWTMNTRDLDIIKAKVPALEYISPIMTSRTKVVREQKTGEFSINGVYADMFRLRNTELTHGRVLNEMDVAQSRKVCVITKRVHETLFDKGEDPVGKTILINRTYYRIVGVAKGTSNTIWLGGDPNATVYLPYTTMQSTVRWGDNFWMLACSNKSGYDISRMEKEMKDILRANHDISPTDDLAFHAFSMREVREAYNNIAFGITFLVWLVGLGALLSGVIGISNIMLVTVRERMREIGIRRALGAKPKAIAAQIMSESLVLTTVAGLGGFLFGMLVLTGLRVAMSSAAAGGGMAVIPQISFDLAMGAMAILIASGLLAGLMPTVKALKIKAIDAIRDE